LKFWDKFIKVTCNNSTSTVLAMLYPKSQNQLVIPDTQQYISMSYNNGYGGMPMGMQGGGNFNGGGGGYGNNFNGGSPGFNRGGGRGRGRRGSSASLLLSGRDLS
jgi:hypothetical protein